VRRPVTYTQTNLVSNIPGLAIVTDPELVNPWGFSHSATSPFWVSNQGTGTATLYAVTSSNGVTKTNVNPSPQPRPRAVWSISRRRQADPKDLPVRLATRTQRPSWWGTVGTVRELPFIFDSLNGTISAWDTGLTAFTQVTVAGASFTGLAINQAQTELYAANDAGTGGIDVFNSAFAPVSLGASAFATPTAITSLGLVPFNVQDIGGDVYVTYAPPGHAAQTTATEEWEPWRSSMRAGTCCRR